MANDDVDGLCMMMAELQVANQVRKQKKMDFPPEGTVAEFEALSLQILKRNKQGSRQMLIRKIVQFFGCPPLVMAKLWELIRIENYGGTFQRGVTKTHLLWALHYMKEYGSHDACAKNVDVKSTKTFEKWTWFFMFELKDLVPVVIRWENRKVNDRGNDCLVVVDTTDCHFQQIRVPDPNNPGKTMINKALYSHKFEGPGLRYEVASSILSNDIVHIAGPYAPGDYNDVMIFEDNLIHKLEAGERVEADAIYYTLAPQYVKCTKSIESTEEEDEMRKRLEGRHENLNKRIKHWKCLVHVFKGKGTAEEKIEKHNALFRACCVVTQVAMEMGVQELYEVGDYK